MKAKTKHVGRSHELAGSPNQLFYHLEQRLNVLLGFQSPKVGIFIRETLDEGPWLDLILFKPGSARIERYGYINPPKDEAEALEMCAPGIIRNYAATLECVKLNRLNPCPESWKRLQRRHATQPSAR
jgi:hypothetical protein